MASQLSHISTGQSGNRSDYQAAFLQHVHRLLQLAYESLTPSEYQRAEEDDITGDLCKHMKLLTEIAPTERWMGRFSIHDQDPSNDVPSAKTGAPRKGKRRPKIDVRIVCKHQTPNRGFCVEAKRLYRSDSVAQYVDEEGVGAFVCGDYAVNDDFGGMMGYVQTDSISKWLPKIESQLPKRPSTHTSKSGEALERVSFKGGPKHCYRSTHDRDTGSPIALIHVFLEFVE